MVKINYQLNNKKNILIRLTLRMENYTLSPKKQYKSQHQIDKIKEINSYINNRVMPILSPLQMELITIQPKDLSNYCVSWLKNYQIYAKQHDKQPVSDQQPDDVFKERIRLKLKGRNRYRKGVSGESTKENFHIFDSKQVISKNQWPQQIRINLLMHLKKCVFFQHLSSENLLKLISHMRNVEFKQGEVVIRQGDVGNQLFIVEQGRFKCQKQNSFEILKQYTTGQIFGELALLYNHPRASTITACTTGRLFGLGRQQFSRVLRSNMVQKLKECEELVSKVQIFQNLNIFERSKLFQSMEVRTIGPDKYVIRQGEVGNCFYIVASGQLVAYKHNKNQMKLVYAYKRGDYFGELALLKNEPRKATIKTITEAKLIFISKDTFFRVLGPLENIRRRNQQRYAHLNCQFSGELL